MCFPWAHKSQRVKGHDVLKTNWSLNRNFCPGLGLNGTELEQSEALGKRNESDPSVFIPMAGHYHHFKPLVIRNCPASNHTASTQMSEWHSNRNLHLQPPKFLFYSRWMDFCNFRLRSYKEEGHSCCGCCALLLTHPHSLHFPTGWKQAGALPGEPCPHSAR